MRFRNNQWNWPCFYQNPTPQKYKKKKNWVFKDLEKTENFFLIPEGIIQGMLFESLKPQLIFNWVQDCYMYGK